MVKKRSAISKSMAKKNARNASTSSSGTLSTKTSKSNGPLHYGKLNRRQKQDLMEYGELIPKDFEMDAESDQEQGQEANKRRRVVIESELDRELEEERAGLQFEEDSGNEQSDDGDDEENWEKPSAYSTLLGMLKKTSKHQGFYEKIRREQEGIDGMELGAEESESDPMDESDQALESDASVEDDNASEISEEVEDKLSDDDEVNIQLDVDDDTDEETSEDSTNLFEKRYKDEQPKSFDEHIAAIEQKKWITNVYNDALLTNVSSYTVIADEDVKRTAPIKSLEQANVKAKVAKLWKEANLDCVQQKDVLFAPLQEQLFRHMNHYRDILYCNRSIHNAKEIRHAYALHIINHIVKVRDRVLKNSAKITKLQKENKPVGEFRDQGFTRPRVLVILPFRNAAAQLVDVLIKLSGTEQQENKKRFYEEFSLREKDKVDEDKPEDFKETFQGNIDDHFRLAIKLTKKSMKFYSDYYNADIIIASPLGLRTAIGSEGDNKRDFDYLSSIEVVVMDQAHQFLMQNWEHIEHVFSHMNLIPKDAHGCDISRIKSWYLDGKARYLRQTLVFSEFLSPDLNAFFNKSMKNVAGKLKMKQDYEGSIVDVVSQAQQTFTRLDSPSLLAMNDTRFKYFVEKTLPSLRKSAITQSHTLVFIPSYFDFVRVRNYLEDSRYAYESCSEYSSGSAIARARTQFFHGRTNLLLYTERCHFFRRYNIRGTFHIVFYGLPEHPQFYTEVVNFLAMKFNDASAAEEATYSCTALFSKYDLLKLERIVGSDRAKKMCTAQKNIFMFA